MSFVPVDKKGNSDEEVTYVMSPKKAGVIVGSISIVIGILLAVVAGFYPIYVIGQGKDPLWYDSRVAASGIAAIFLGFIAFVAGEWFLKNWVDPDSDKADEALSPLVAILLIGGGILVGMVWMWMDGKFEAYEKS